MKKKLGKEKAKGYKNINEKLNEPKNLIIPET